MMHYDAEWITAYTGILILFASMIRGYLNLMTKLDRIEQSAAKIPEHEDKIEAIHDATTRHDERIKVLERQVNTRRES